MDAAVSGHEARNALEAAVGDCLDNLTTMRLRIVPPILLGLIMLFDSWDSIAIAYALPLIASDWKLSAVEMGTLISAGYAGQFVGAIFLGALAERYGRLRVFLISMTLMCALAIWCAVSSSYSELIILRFIQGVTIGGALPVSITYINELAPTPIRGRYFSIFQFICMSGYAAASISSTVIVPNLGWRWMFGLGALPILLLPIVPLLLPESPRWLARAGRRIDARAALAKLGGVMPQTDVADGSENCAPAPPIPAATLFRPPYRNRTIIVLLLWFLTSFASFGLVTWVPSIYVRVFHIPVAQALRYSATASVLFLLIAPTVALVIDHVGRRPIAILGTAVASMGLLAVAVHPPSSTVILVTLIIAGQCGVNTGSMIVWPYTAETYPTSMRAVALGLSSSMARAASMLTPLAVGVILGYGGPIRLVFGIFGVCAISALTLWLTATRETAKIRLENL